LRKVVKKEVRLGDNPNKIVKFSATCMRFKSKPTYFPIMSSVRKALGL
jgi:hypothetical protein